MVEPIKTFREVGQIAEGVYNSILPEETIEGRKQVLSIGADRYYIPSTLKRQLLKKAILGRNVHIRFRGLSASGRFMFDVTAEGASQPTKRKRAKKGEGEVAY